MLHVTTANDELESLIRQQQLLMEMLESNTAAVRALLDSLNAEYRAQPARDHYPPVEDRLPLLTALSAPTALAAAR
jgi:hypothetical protein